MKKHFINNQLKTTIIFILIIQIEIIINNNNNLNRKIKFKEEFRIKKNVNLNEIESNFPFGRRWNSYNFSKQAINIGSSLDPRYILKAIITTVSIIASQKSSTKLRLHFSVVNNFNTKDMIKIYKLGID